jgi:hypothetical protein
MVYTMWTDAVEKMLTVIKQNVTKLSSNYLEQYQSLTRKTWYLNVPLVLLSAVNTYVIFDMDAYSHTVQMVSAGTSLAVATVLGGELCFGFQAKMETAFAKHKDFMKLQERIEKVLATERDDRDESAGVFVKAMMDDYKRLIASDAYILQYGGNLLDAVEDQVEDMQSFLEDHWNILYRPQFRRIKKKNERVIEALKSTGQELVSTLESIVEPVKEEAKEDKDSKDENKKPWLSSMLCSKGEEKVSETNDALESKPEIKQTSWLSSLWGTNGESSEETKETKQTKNENDQTVEKTVEFSSIYPKQTIQRVIMEQQPKRTGFSMNFQDKK